MKTYIKLLFLLVILGMGLTACDTQEAEPFVPMRDLVVADGFNWQASRDVNIDLEVYTNNGVPMENIYFEIHNANPNGASEIVAKGATGTSGKFETVINVPGSVKKLWAVGWMSTIELPIVNNAVNYVYGGWSHQQLGGEGFNPPDSRHWSYLPGMNFNNNGVPSPMTTVPLSTAFLNKINASLPERKSVPQYHPSYLDQDNQSNLKIDELAEVWVTFVHEGADYKNALGFYTYPTGTTPQTPDQLGSKTILLPNASLSGSGGGLQPGNTLYLGVFQPNTTIGWLLAANGFISGSNVRTNVPMYYSDVHLNPETAQNKKQHSVLVYDEASQRLVIGFEDLPRQNGSDDDFNDLIFFVTINPITAVDLENIPPIDIPGDRDRDGISDLFDEYPDDPELAFNNYTYGPDSWGTLAFEDLWPNVGDYDFNDIVVDYKYNQITQAGNLVKKVEMFYKFRATGARNANGFAVQLPFPSSNLANVQPIIPALFEHETDGPKAVFRFFNSAFDLIPQPTGFINTNPDQPYYQPVDFGVSFYLQSPVAISNITPTPPYNPFIFVGGVRSHEVHLPGYAPTSKMDLNLYGTGDDTSVPNQGRWYKTVNNLPFAVNIPVSFNYPTEHSQLTRAYLKFKDWAQSNGSIYPDWYKSMPGYTDPSYIYMPPR